MLINRVVHLVFWDLGFGSFLEKWISHEMEVFRESESERARTTLGDLWQAHVTRRIPACPTTLPQTLQCQARQFSVR